jgi:hypothetical protein
MRLLLNWSQMIDRQSSSKTFAMGHMRCGRSEPPAPDAVREVTRMVRTTQTEAGILIRGLDPGTVDAT